MVSLISRTLKRRYHRIFLPEIHFSDDVFLVSYPKSGNTWLRFLISNAIRQHFNIEQKVNFFTIRKVFPSVHLAGEIRPEGMYSICGLPRFIKSHCDYNPYYNSVFLLVRDPRDVMASYFHYRKVRGCQQNVFDFIRDRKYGIEAWINHTESWTGSKKDGQNVHLIKYEDLHRDPRRELMKVFDLLGIEISQIALEIAISESSFEKMKESEKLSANKAAENKQEPLNSEEVEVMKTNNDLDVRKGRIGFGSELSDFDRKYIEEKAKRTAEKLGYF